MAGMTRGRQLSIHLTDEEYEFLFETAALGGQWTSQWARDVLISRAVALHTQREAVMAL